MSKDKPEVGDIIESKRLGLCKIISTNERVSFCFIKDLDGDYNLMPVFNTYLIRFGKFKGNNPITLDELFKTENEEKWAPLSELGSDGIDFDLISSNEFLECVKVQGFVDDDGNGYPVIKTNDGTFLYNKKKSVYPSEVQNKDKLDFDYVVWFNK